MRSCHRYLDDFYRDMKQYGFALQVHLLQVLLACRCRRHAYHATVTCMSADVPSCCMLAQKRFRQQQEIVWTEAGAVQDRTIYEDAVFARMLKNSGLMTERDYDTYLSLFNHMSNFMRKPNVIIHLEVSPEESLERIKSRSRGCETGISLEYLQGLHTAYEEFIADISRVIPVIKVNWSTFQSTEDVARSVREEYLKISAIRHVDFGGDAKANAAAAAAAAAAGPSTAARDAKQGLAPQLSRASPPPAEVPTSS